eukprot:symbB.v1.2.024848.t1/scaffold2376.1/size80753/3
MDDVDVIAEALHEVSGKTPEEMDTGMDEAPKVQPENTPSGDAAEVPPEESVAFTKMSIKQLKQFLHCRGVRVPGSITEKADLVALVEESKDLPVRSEEELQRAAEAAKAKEKEAQEAKEAKEAQEAKAAEKPQAAETPESQDTEKPWHMPWQPPDPSTPPGTWNPMHMPHMPGPVPIPQMPNFGLWLPFMPTMPTMPPMSTTVPPAPRVVPPKKNLQWPPKTREEALNFQSNRLMNLRIEPGVLQNLTRFCKFHNLNSEAETALKMLGVDLQSFMSDGTVRANMTGAYDPHHTLIAEVSKRDSQAAYLMRMLLPGPRAPPTCTTSKAAPEKPKPASPERSPVAAVPVPSAGTVAVTASLWQSQELRSTLALAHREPAHRELVHRERKRSQLSLPPNQRPLVFGVLRPRLWHPRLCPKHIRPRRCPKQHPPKRQ